jgi:hypothetical protein
MTSTVIAWLVACMGFRSFQIGSCGLYMDSAAEQTTTKKYLRTDCDV